MKQGYLSQYFEAVAAKRLTAVEVNKKVSNQHEFNGTAGLKQVLGVYDTGETSRFPAQFVWMGEENETITAEGTLSWYDSRFKNATRAAEWRLFYPANDVMEMALEGDLLFIAKRTDGTLLSVIVAAGSTVENQMLWLFGVPVQTGNSFVYQDIGDEDDREVDFAVRFILEELGIDVEEPEADQLDFLLEKFNGKFPKTAEFSLYARQTITGVSAMEEPDKTLIAWMNQEEKLFKRLERRQVQERLQSGFSSDDGLGDVEGFLSFSLSVQNRRKSRAGLALESHLEEIFRTHGILYSRVAQTENKSKPDFLFPSQSAYRNNAFPSTLLTMLGVKTTCKDRWRQVLSEAARIEDKHLFTLEPGISENQTDEMRAQHLQLVLPASIHESYRADQRAWLMTLAEFISLAAERQTSGIAGGFH